MCVCSKGKDNHHISSKDKDLVIQIDFAFASDDKQKERVCLSCSDILSSMGAMAVVPSKACLTYAVTTAKSFVLEAGRTHGFLQCDNEPTILSIAKSVIRELGGLKLRRPPTYSSQ